MLSSVAVFCGSSDGTDPIYLTSAEEMGRLLGQQKIDVIYGGGMMGTMGKVADGALAAKGRVFGFITTELMEKEKGHPKLTSLHLSPSMRERKSIMFKRAQAFIILPGGFGTLDEVCEILTLKQLNFHKKPILFVNTQHYWDIFFCFLRHIEKEAFIQPQHLNLFKIVDTPQEALDFFINLP